jgi:hypothetical protein
MAMAVTNLGADIVDEHVFDAKNYSLAENSFQYITVIGK